MKIVNVISVEETKTTTRTVTMLEDKVKIDNVGDVEVSIIDHDNSLALITIKGNVETANLKSNSVLTTLPKKYVANQYRLLKCPAYNDKNEMVGLFHLSVKGKEILFRNLFTVDGTTRVHIGVGYNELIS